MPERAPRHRKRYLRRCLNDGTVAGRVGIIDQKMTKQGALWLAVKIAITWRQQPVKGKPVDTVEWPTLMFFGQIAQNFLRWARVGDYCWIRFILRVYKGKNNYDVLGAEAIDFNIFPVSRRKRQQKGLKPSLAVTSDPDLPRVPVRRDVGKYRAPTADELDHGAWADAPDTVGAAMEELIAPEPVPDDPGASDAESE